MKADINGEDSYYPRSIIKVKTFWEGHKFWKKYPTCFDVTEKCQNKWETFSNFVAFLENLNFTLKYDFFIKSCVVIV